MVAMLYAWFFQEILGYLLSLSGDRPLSEDITQDTFLRALRNADTLQDMAKPACRAWLYKTARNMFIDRMRRKKLENGCLPSAEGYEEDFTAIEVREALEALSEEDRELFSLRYLQGWNAAEIGGTFGLPAATVRTRLMRARMTLKKALAEETKQEETHGKVQEE